MSEQDEHIGSVLEAKLVALIAHLVTAGLEVEHALTLAQEYALGHYLQALSFIPLFPREAKRVRDEAQIAAEAAVIKALRPAWIATEAARTAEEPPQRSYSREEVLHILQPFVLNEKDWLR